MTKLFNFFLCSELFIVVSIEAENEPDAIDVFKATFGLSLFNDVTRITKT